MTRRTDTAASTATATATATAASTTPTGVAQSTGAAQLTREQLLVQHAEARRRRNTAPLGSEEWAEASAEVGRIEVEIARVERAMDPPRV